MQVMRCLFLAVTLILVLIQQSAALPIGSTHLTLHALNEINSNLPGVWKRGLIRNIFHRKKKTEDEIQEDIKNKVLLNSERELRAKDLKRLKDEDFHKYMSQHISRLDDNESNKLAKHLEKKAEKHSYIRAKSLDAIHKQLEKEDENYKSQYEIAHWQEDYEKTAQLAKDKNPTIDHLHQTITQSQQQINRLHDASKDLDKHVKKLWRTHNAQREAEGKDVKKSTDKTLVEAHETIKKMDMFPNLKKTYEVQEAKKVEDAAKLKKEAEEKAQKKASKNAGASVWPLQGKIGSILGYKSPSKNSNAEGSNKSQSSADNQRNGSGSGRNGGSVSDAEKEGSSKSGSGRNSSSDEEDGSGVSSTSTSQSSSPTSVIPGYSNPGSDRYQRKNSL